MSQKFQIAIDPALGITDEMFIAAWNENPEALNHGRIAKSTLTRSAFGLELAVLLLTAATGVASSVLSSLILDLIRHKYPLKKEQEAIMVTQEDGTQLIVIKAKD